MKYVIKYGYRTGDSFHTENRESVLEHEWESKDLVKQNMKRIKEHYQWIEDKDSYFVEEPAKRPEWHRRERLEQDSVSLILDNGEKWIFRPPWIGYFEGLIWLELGVAEDPDARIDFN